MGRMKYWILDTASDPDSHAVVIPRGPFDASEMPAELAKRKGRPQSIDIDDMWDAGGERSSRGGCTGAALASPER